MATSALRRQPATRTATSSRAHQQVTKRHALLGTQRFMPLPAPRGSWPYRLELAEMLPPAAAEALAQAGHVRFHSVGDSGGVPDPGAQRAVAAAMAAELDGADPARFFYHLGDVVYGYGEESEYAPQFFEPYAGYGAPIFAVPGNHDGDLAPDSTAHSLAAFVEHFCAPRAVPEPSQRATTQPNVYWTLRHPWLTIVGLYTNVPDGGRIAEDQVDWLVAELAEAPRDAVLILALHHCVYSTDLEHGSNLALADLLDGAFARARRAPDLVLSGHVHSYQRFSRRYRDRVVPHLVAGTGGVCHLQKIAADVPSLPASFEGLPGVTLEAYQDESWGYLSVSCGPGGAEVLYRTVSGGVVRPFDSVSVALARV
ncbi:MAG TPA: metallophosphoesterase [Solirubrobacteraceae bacterium]|nr:metallophosphoesterase [Solirubrobacteraceae bacterium]